MAATTSWFMVTNPDDGTRRAQKKADHVGSSDAL
eukprot:CAMPEP_0171545282 /NCGR_PEP_ID=MMETSP0960-20121227/3982_1 /TAXON_ID=87120 /ORGANISM="Aurantiochytrium limacinum, Strain ATCCMYA-1381" /LENGTH=33 /DNA_ID= /DNA_START= /DNA_END= /DNA_ORIENTATION=